VDSNYIFARKKGRQLSKEMRTKGYKGICNYGFITGKNWRIGGNSACHAGLRRAGENIDYVVDIVYPVKSAKSALQTDEMRIAYMDFIMNCKAYEGVIVNRNAKYCFHQGYVVANTDVPSNQLASCLFSLRMGNERPEMIKVWWELVQIGVDKDIAYIFAHSINILEGDVFFKGYVESHHIGINTGKMGVGGVYNFIDGVLEGANEDFYEATDYNSVNALFGYHGDFHSHFLEYVQKNIGESKGKKREYLFYGDKPKKINKTRFLYGYNFKSVALKLANEIRGRKL